eukprot:403334184
MITNTFDHPPFVSLFGIDTHIHSVYDSTFCNQEMFQRRNANLKEMQERKRPGGSLLPIQYLYDASDNQSNYSLLRNITITKKRTANNKDRSVLLFTSLHQISEADQIYMNFLKKQVAQHGLTALEKRFLLFSRFRSQMKEMIYEIQEKQQPMDYIDEEMLQNPQKVDMTKVRVKPLAYIRLYGQYQESRFKLVSLVFAKYISACLIPDAGSHIQDKLYNNQIVNRRQAEQDSDHYTFTFRGYVFNAQEKKAYEKKPQEFQIIELESKYTQYNFDPRNYM